MPEKETLERTAEDKAVLFTSKDPINPMVIVSNVVVETVATPNVTF